MFKHTLLTTFVLFCVLAVRGAPIARADTHTGDVTFFSPGVGACGTTNSEQDLIVAVSAQLFLVSDPQGEGENPNNNPLCGRDIKATSSDGKSVIVKVEDMCFECGADDLDMSPAAFSQLADFSVGRLQGVTWEVL